MGSGTGQRKAYVRIDFRLRRGRELLLLPLGPFSIGVGVWPDPTAAAACSEEWSEMYEDEESRTKARRNLSREEDTFCIM